MANRFTEILLQARRRSLASMGRLEARFYRLYLEALNEVLEGYGDFDIDSKKKAEDFLKAIERQEAKYGRAANRLIKQQIVETMQRTAQAHLDAIEEVAGRLDNVRSPFSGISKEAFEDLFKRRNMGLTASYKSLSDFQKGKAGIIIEKQLERAVLRGATWQDATQAVVDGLTQGDPDMRRMAKNMARKSKGLGLWLDRALEDPEGVGVSEVYLENIKKARKIAYDARRIVRTELAHAHHEADRVSSVRSDVVKGVKWNLSPRHPETDICDVYAFADLHGLGPGVFPPEFLPPLPHPHCLCFMTHVLTEPGEKVPAATEPRLITGNMTKRIMQKVYREGGRRITDRFVESTMSQVNDTAKLMIEIANEG